MEQKTTGDGDKRFKIVALGCRTNQYEAQAFRDQLLAKGYRPAADGEAAELCIVNSCTVTEQADRSSRHEARRLARENPGAKLFVTGCSAEKQPELLRAIPGVSAVVPNARKERLLEELFPGEALPEFAINRFEAHTRAFVKVQDGCNSFCTYCVIPYVRGRSRSRTLPEVLDEVRRLVDTGYKEVVLTGINIGDFDGGDASVRLAELVRAVDAVEGLQRLRISSIDPDEVDDELLDAVINGKTTCPSMHLVLQSGSNVILKRMNRKYTRQVFLDTVDRLVNANGSFTFTTDVIVGFPGETDADHAETMAMVEQVRFAKVHMFPYSPRPRTRAALLPGRVPAEVMQRRKQELMHHAEQASFALRQQYVGSRRLVLTEGRHDEDPRLVGGHTDNFLQVWIDDPSLQANELVAVDLVANAPSGLIGIPTRKSTP